MFRLKKDTGISNWTSGKFESIPGYIHIWSFNFGETMKNYTILIKRIEQKKWDSIYTSMCLNLCSIRFKSLPWPFIFNLLAICNHVTIICILRFWIRCPHKKRQTIFMNQVFFSTYKYLITSAFSLSLSKFIGFLLRKSIHISSI